MDEDRKRRSGIRQRTELRYAVFISLYIVLNNICIIYVHMCVIICIIYKFIFYFHKYEFKFKSFIKFSYRYVFKSSN